MRQRWRREFCHGHSSGTEKEQTRIGLATETIDAVCPNGHRPWPTCLALERQWKQATNLKRWDDSHYEIRAIPLQRSRSITFSCGPKNIFGVLAAKKLAGRRRPCNNFVTSEERYLSFGPITSFQMA